MYQPATVGNEDLEVSWRPLGALTHTGWVRYETEGLSEAAGLYGRLSCLEIWRDFSGPSSEERK